MKPLLSASLAVLLASCGNVLQPVKDSPVNHLLDSTVPERPLTAAVPAVAIARPSLPSYLDRQQLVSRKGGGELEMNNNHLWAEPLDAAISRVTALNLGRLTRSMNIQPVENFVTLDYASILEIRVSRFEPDAGGQVVFQCTWKLQPVHGRLAATRTFHITVPVETTTPPMDGRIGAMNEALVRLAREIAKSAE